MISSNALEGIAFPWILLGQNNEIIANGNGALFPSPEHSFEAALNTASAMLNGGWGKCLAGFSLYRFTNPILERNSIVLHGLKISGHSTAQGRSNTLSIKLTQQELLKYVQSYCASLESIADHYNSLIRHNIHEIRGINSELYNTAFGLHSNITSGNVSQQKFWTSTAKSVVNWSELLRGRIDFMEFIANPSIEQVFKNSISPYRKFDKLQRCFRVTASKRSITLDIAGGSTKEIYGPPIFDLIPFLLIENSIKYSPNGCAIKISCSDGQQSILCSVTSTGPRILDNELEKLFSPGFRGENAIKSQSGSGLGLSVLKKIVATVFKGSVTVRQSSTDLQTINGIPYCDITFELRLPTK